ncbi:MAG: hypothetical protein QXW00_04565 [Candidatus Woesearchaeota archaeon]
MGACSYIKKSLVEADKSVILPILRDGNLKPWIKVTYEFSTLGEEYELRDNLTYVTVPKDARIEFDRRLVQVSLKERGVRVDYVNFMMGPCSIEMDRFSVARLNPNIPFRIKASDRLPYYSFEILENFSESDKKSYDTPLELKISGITRKNLSINSTEVTAITCEKEIISLPGVMIYPEQDFSGCYKLFGKFNGSPELEFGYCQFYSKLERELLHSHEQVIEAYLGIRGSVSLFIACDDGDIKIKGVDLDGIIREWTGEIVKIDKHDLVIPLTAHKLLLSEEYSKLPATLYKLSYSHIINPEKEKILEKQ